ncbi:MAG: ATP-binding protein [Pseudomonadota bacterium]
MRSIRDYLGVGLAVSLVAVFLLQWLVVSATVRQLSESGFQAHMEHDIENLLAGLSFDAAGRLRLAPDRIENVYQRPFSGSYYRITAGGQALRSRSLWDEDLPAVAAAAGGALTQRVPGPQSQPLLMHTRVFDWQGRRIAISVAEDLTPLETEMRQFRNRYALVSLAALALLLALQAWLVRRGLRPLRHTRAQLRQLDQGEVTRLDEEVPAELAPLVKELNLLLAAMTQRLARSRQALGNLAHALKGPLTLLTHRLADAKGRPDETAQRQLETMKHLIEHELRRARLSGAALPGRRFDFAAELPALVETLKALYRDKPLAINLRMPAAVAYPADREDMLELLGNLLDNACKWSRHEVLLEVAISEGVITLRVHDDGPGCPDESLASLAQRGTRLDESTPGQGLGLAIAMQTASDYGGRISFGRSEILGGFVATVHLPAAGR